MTLIIVGIILLYFGAESLVRGSAKLAHKYGIPPLIVGLTIVAFGTSAPELTVSLSAAFKGASDVALGNVVGSNIFNIAFILGLAAVICPIKVHLDLIRQEIPIMIGVSLIAFALMLLHQIPRAAGILLFTGLCLYTAFSIRAAKQQPATEAFAAPPAPQAPTWLLIASIVAGLGLLVLGSTLFVNGAIALARSMGISEAVIGLTIVAAGTSLPELATSVVAALKKESDVAIGNIVGSNIFNILCILGLTATVLPIETGVIGLRDGLFMLGLSLLLLPLALSQRSISRGEGLLFLSIYGLYLYLLWPAAGS